MGLTRLGLTGRRVSILTTIGRKSGVPRSVPVSVINDSGARYLVAPYGVTGWVHNIRASGTARLRSRDGEEEISATEVHGEEGGRILQQYWKEVRVVRPYFDVTDESDMAGFISELPRHPVFCIEAPRI
jgi:deazaflavin-dependent oxidoreductase (nitroreductase family)